MPIEPGNSWSSAKPMFVGYQIRPNCQGGTLRNTLIKARSDCEGNVSMVDGLKPIVSWI